MSLKAKFENLLDFGNKHLPFDVTLISYVLYTVLAPVYIFKLSAPYSSCHSIIDFLNEATFLLKSEGIL